MDVVPPPGARAAVRLLAGFAALLAGAALVNVAPAEAVAPGRNGRLAVTSGGQVVLTGPDGTGRTTVTSDPAFHGTPSLAPDGRRLALVVTRFVTPESTQSALAVINVDGSGLRTLTRGKVDAFDPAWSPDGRRIAFTRGVAGTDSLIAVIGADGTGLRLLTRPLQGVGSDSDPAWSPDGQRLAFVSYRSGLPQIWTVSASGGAPRRLSPATASDGDPSWSPDGRWIAVVRERRVNPHTSAADLWLLSTSGGRAVRVTRTSAFESHPAWAPDGTRLAVATGFADTARITILSPAGRRLGPARPIAGATPDWGRHAP